MSFGDAEAQHLLDLLALSLGYRPDGRLPQIQRATLNYARDTGTSVSTLVARHDAEFMDRLIAAATVGHTGFFRHDEQFERLRKELSRRRARAPVTLWSAGCSTGEEPVSLAVAAREADVEVRILATDINESALDRARHGRFANPLPAQVRAEDVPSLLATIEFRRVALPWPDPREHLGQFDIVFCRNVLIYFTPDAAAAILDSISERLAPDGFLVVSPVEALLPLPPGFRTVDPLGWLERTRALPYSGRLRRVITSHPPHPEHLPRSRPPSAAPIQLGSGPPRSHPPAHGDPLTVAASKLGLGALAEAESVLRGLLDADADQPRAWFLLGEALSRRGELTQARLAFHAAARTGHRTHAEDALIAAARRRARQAAEPTET